MLLNRALSRTSVLRTASCFHPRVSAPAPGAFAGAFPAGVRGLAKKAKPKVGKKKKKNVLFRPNGPYPVFLEEVDLSKLLCTVLIERPPIICPPLNKWETDFEDTMTRQEDGNIPMPTLGIPPVPKYMPTYLDAMRHANLEMCAKPTQGEDGVWRYSDEDIYENMQETKQEDSEISWTVRVNTGKGSVTGVKRREVDEFIPLHPITDADLNKDFRSLNRELAQELYLILKQDGKWVLPNTSGLEEEISMMGFARKYVDATFDFESDTIVSGPVDFVSAAPSMHLPGKGVDGADAFCFRMEVVKRDFDFVGAIKFTKAAEDIAWVTKSELNEYLEKDSVHHQFATELSWKSWY